MEIILSIKCPNHYDLVDFYFEKLKLFNIINDQQESTNLVYKYDNEIMLHISKSDVLSDTFKCQIQIPDVQQHFSALQIEPEFSIQQYPFGDSVTITDLIGNVIFFYDKNGTWVSY